MAMRQARSITASTYAPARPAMERNSLPQARPLWMKIKLAAIVAACFFLSLVVVAQYSSLVMINGSLGAARSEMVQLKAELGSLELEAARLASTRRVEQVAREELGLIDPRIDRLRVIGGPLSSRRQGE